MKEKMMVLLKESGPMSVDQLGDSLGMKNAKEFTSLVKEISRLEGQGKLSFTDEGTIALKKFRKKNVVPKLEGIFHAHKSGFGFVTVDEAEPDVFIGRDLVNHAIDGDRVRVEILKVADRMKGSSAEGKIVDVLERSLTRIVGKVILEEGKSKYPAYIRSRNQKINQPIYIQKGDFQLQGTEVVKLVIRDYPNKKHPYFVADLIEIVGQVDDTGIDVLEVLESMDIVSTFPDAVLAEAEAIPDVPSAKDMEGRLDLRSELTFTIDGADAKDLDDAVHIKRLDGGNFELGVHIADVSYYVKEGSALDKEALERGTSVYVTDRVVPMLPERLSNGICSLNPQVDRLTQSAIMEIDRRGKVVRYQLAETVIKTSQRMTYSDVNAMIAGQDEVIQAYPELLESVAAMVDLHKILEQMRVDRGALNFDTNEAKILVNANGKPVDIVLRQRGLAERMIESFMLVANETVAEHFYRKDLPFIYRIHEDPKAEKLQKFIDFTASFGLRIYGTASKMTQASLQDIMAAAKGQVYEEVLAMMLLRSMQQARYSEHNHDGHYGLAAPFYTHFTSPIRRYPDLMVHRMMRDYRKSTEKAGHFQEVLPAIASQSSNRERRAIDAERFVESMKKAEFMSDFVGQEFDGVIASVVKFGIFVELSNTVEGLIHVTNLPEFYHFDERTLSLRGERTGTTFRVGQPIRIRVERADKETGEIDFAYLAGGEVEKKSSRSKRSQRERKKKREQSQPFYKKQVKKGGRHGQRRGKGRRSK
ncbi:MULTISPECIES: ribonuclease R [unclassified Streptococcus]|uniref:ribonuclease R n=1 Tax=unclassified Streptococcus TaxID=2608887 RepID=UPI001072E437|nr:MULTISPECIES: ribonuclease R [unclassified Streptococcus]MBF0806544.1 ribonuclease R [Streptococcus sp. 19428wA2_WM07]TFU27594.1 ribonuclease R [Streptococcus sp. WM07]